jgi:hypothetical protein
MVPLTPSFPWGFNLVNRGFTVKGDFKKRNPRERRGCSVYAVNGRNGNAVRKIARNE